MSVYKNKCKNECFIKISVSTSDTYFDINFYNHCNNYPIFDKKYWSFLQYEWSFTKLFKFNYNEVKIILAFLIVCLTSLVILPNIVC